MDSLLLNREARALCHLVIFVPKWLFLVLPGSGQTFAHYVNYRISNICADAKCKMSASITALNRLG
jgi:hypothetical protein